MSRERPIEPPRVVPDAERGKTLKPNQLREREEIRRLGSMHGSGLLGAIFNPFGRLGMPMPKFIRRGYEAAIVDELNDFFARRPRPWRPASCAPKRTHKERLKAQRRARA